MSSSGVACAFCSAAREVGATPVIDEKWSRRFGGEPVVTLDHGSYRSSRGTRVAAAVPGAAKYFQPVARALCDFCDHGWAEDVRWRAEPSLLSMAEGGRQLPPDASPLLRWLRLTAMLAELIDSMRTASTPAQRSAVRRNDPPEPAVPAWLFTTRQRTPARIHLSQVDVGGADDVFVQVVSVELAHFTGLVVIPSAEAAAALVERSRLVAALQEPDGLHDATVARVLDLSATPRPHGVAVHRLCTASSAVRASG